MNQAKTRKTIVTFQRNHTFRTTPELRAIHDEGVGVQRMEFIRYAFTN